VVAVHVIERAPPLHRNAQPAEAVVAYCRRHAVGHILLVVAEEGVGRRAAARLLDAPAVDVVPVLLQQTAVVVLQLGQPFLRVPASIGGGHDEISGDEIRIKSHIERAQ